MLPKRCCGGARSSKGSKRRFHILWPPASFLEPLLDQFQRAAKVVALAKLSQTGGDNRNHALHEVTFCLGQLVAAGVFMGRNGLRCGQV